MQRQKPHALSTRQNTCRAASARANSAPFSSLSSPSRRWLPGRPPIATSPSASTPSPSLPTCSRSASRRYWQTIRIQPSSSARRSTLMKPSTTPATSAMRVEAGQLRTPGNTTPEPATVPRRLPGRASWPTMWKPTARRPSTAPRREQAPTLGAIRPAVISVPARPMSPSPIERCQLTL